MYRYSSLHLFLSPCHHRGSNMQVPLALRMLWCSSFPSSGQLISHEFGYQFAQDYPSHQWQVGGALPPRTQNLFKDEGKGLLALSNKSKAYLLGKKFLLH